MDKHYVLKITIFIGAIALISVASFGHDFYKYKHSSDLLEGLITIDSQLHSEFFDTNETSYPWYIIEKHDGTFENTLSQEITKQDQVPIEHTSNCISTHQGEHKMDFCHAKLGTDKLQLEIYGGLPSFASSLMIEIWGSKFSCFFRAVYPAPVKNLQWKILSKELTLKKKNLKKGERLYAKISVKFEESSTYQGKNIKRKYTIKGYLKPIIN